MKFDVKYEAGSAKGASWILSHLHDDGSFGPGTLEFGFYYKTASALIEAGYPVQALKMLRYTKRTHFLPNGDFRQDLGEYRDDPYWHPYLNSWAIMAAQKMERFDISVPGIEYLLTLQDVKAGGFVSERTTKDEEGLEGIIISSALGFACLCMGRLKEAQRAGDFLVEMLRLQPEKDRMYMNYRPKRGLATEFPPGEEEKYVLDSSKKRQWYFTPGHSLGFLSKLYLATGLERYLEAAKEYFGFASSCYRGDEGINSWVASGKFGWGSSALYNVTGETVYREAGEKIAKYLLDTQWPDGYWIDPKVANTIDQEPLWVTIDITAEFVYWLRAISREIGGRE